MATIQPMTGVACEYMVHSIPLYKSLVSNKLFAKRTRDQGYVEPFEKLYVIDHMTAMSGNSVKKIIQSFCQVCQLFSSHCLWAVGPANWSAEKKCITNETLCLLQAYESFRRLHAYSTTDFLNTVMLQKGLKGLSVFGNNLSSRTYIPNLLMNFKSQSPQIQCP